MLIVAAPHSWLSCYFQDVGAIRMSPQNGWLGKEAGLCLHPRVGHGSIFRTQSNPSTYGSNPVQFNLDVHN